MRLNSSIKILERFCPYTFQPGAKVIIPFTSQGVTVYPKEIRMHGGETFPIQIQGSIDKFMTTLDLERGEVRVFGRGETQFQFSLKNEAGKVVFNLEKGDESLFSKFKLPTAKQSHILQLPRLSFGVTKSQEFEKIVSRQNLQEILPIWFRFGAMMDKCEVPKGESLLSLLKEKGWIPLFRTGFSSLFYPESEDKNRYGYPLPPIRQGENPLSILRFGYEKILQLILDEKEEEIHFLSGMSEISKAGRATLIPFNKGYADFEWTKGFLRRVRLVATDAGKILIKFPKRHRKARLNGAKSISLLPSLELDLTSGSEYFLDHFEE